MDPGVRRAGRRWWTPPACVRAFVARHETGLWWLHSAYALALGAIVMWLGARNFGWLRYSAFYLLFLWISNLVLAEVVARRDGLWWRRTRLAVNYVNRNFYQQLLFFILPLYAGSATLRSKNLLFIVVLGASAVLSTLDIVYDRALSTRRGLAASFFAFNMFAVVNLALPVLFGLSNASALRIAALAAAVGFATLAWSPSRPRRRAAWIQVVAGAVLVLVLADGARPFVPPAPLRLLDTQFGSGIDRSQYRATGSVTAATVAQGQPVFASTALRAPLGLRDRVEMRWYRNGRLLWTSSPHEVVGGRRAGFRLWSAVSLVPADAAGTLRLDVLTSAGQLIGRATLDLRR